jgi:type VI secretion system protein ImpH
MATPSRTSDPSLKPRSTAPASAARLAISPHDFDFFQAVRLLERLLPDRAPVGRSSRPGEEVAHFAAHQSLAFPASQIQSLEFPENRPPAMTVNFMGLTGPLGVLPHWYTELIADRMRNGDNTLRDFLDMINHRFVSFFYRAWEKYRAGLAYETGEPDPLSQVLLDLIGIGTEGFDLPESIAPDAYLFFSGLLAQRPRSALALKLTLEEYFQVPVEVDQFHGAWFSLDDEALCRPGDSVSASEQVAVGAVVGDAMWDPQARVRIKLGPLTLARYSDFLPGQPAFQALSAWTRFFANDEIDFEAQLILCQEEVPPCELGARGEAEQKLGWVSWLSSKPLKRNPSDTILKL